MRRIVVFLSLASCFLLSRCFAQDPPPAPTPSAGSAVSQDPAAALAALSQAFSRGKPVTSVALTGNATWTAGSLQDSGSVRLTASASGDAKVTLQMGSQGNRSESFTGAGIGMTCQWADSAQQNHAIESPNCWKPFVWFLPAFALQPANIQKTLGLLDLGTGRVGSTSGLYHHLLGALLLDTTTSTFTQQVMKDSSADLGLDPATSLPAVLAYTVVPEKGALTPIAIEIRYANYTTVSGVQIPFSIQRYVNGTLQLDITIQNAQLN